MSAKRLYVLVNKNLNPVYGCVQGGHAVAQYLMEYPEQDWNNEYLIYLYADTKQWDEFFTEKGIKHSSFKEPDMNFTITAIAVQDNSGFLFKNLPTVK